MSRSLDSLTCPAPLFEDGAGLAEEKIASTVESAEREMRAPVFIRRAHDASSFPRQSWGLMEQNVISASSIHGPPLFRMNTQALGVLFYELHLIPPWREKRVHRRHCEPRQGGARQSTSVLRASPAGGSAFAMTVPLFLEHREEFSCINISFLFLFQPFISRSRF